MPTRVQLRGFCPAARIALPSRVCRSSRCSASMAMTATPKTTTRVTAKELPRIRADVVAGEQQVGEIPQDQPHAEQQQQRLHAALRAAWQQAYQPQVEADT